LLVARSPVPLSRRRWRLPRSADPLLPWSTTATPTPPVPCLLPSYSGIQVAWMVLKAPKHRPAHRRQGPGRRLHGLLPPGGRGHPARSSNSSPEEGRGARSPRLFRLAVSAARINWPTCATAGMRLCVPEVRSRGGQWLRIYGSGWQSMAAPLSSTQMGMRPLPAPGGG
uniref:Uncharacterized protein n=2 Tax=Aegilops tauschii subsp. strangulata TaxID=200361 RepID=A0A453SGY9_AEGTS